MTKTTIEVFYHSSRVASHRRLQIRQRDPLVRREHTAGAPEIRTYSADEFSPWAISVGPVTEKVVEHFLKFGKAVEKGYKACSGLTKLEQLYGKQQLETACGKALAYSTAPSLRTIASILKNGLDKPDKAGSQPTQPKANSYGITRGAATSGKEATADAEPGNDGYAHGNEDDRYGSGVRQPVERPHVQ